MKTGYLLFAGVVDLLLMVLLAACVVPQKDLPKKVIFRALFAPVTKVMIYTEKGVLFDTLTTPNLDLDLEPGKYYVDLKDDYGNSAFDLEGGTNFIPSIQGATIEQRPIILGGITQPMIRITVPDKDIGQTQQPIHGFSSIADAKARMVWEAARAMVGPNGATNMQNNWPTGDVYSTYPYIAEDVGAWNALLNSSRYGYGWYVSCRRNINGPNLYEGLGVNCRVVYGSADGATKYGCQSESCSASLARSRGGQCKPFINLVAYRSGVLHGANWSFKALPSDDNLGNQPMATYSTIAPGDLLRRPYGHALIVVRKISSTQVIIFDSNWLGLGNGDEVIGSHVLGFSGSGDNNLGGYRNLTCVYNENC